MKIDTEFLRFIKVYKKVGVEQIEQKKKLIDDVKYKDPIEIKYDRERGGWDWLLYNPPVWNFFHVLRANMYKDATKIKVCDIFFGSQFCHWIKNIKDAYSLLKLLKCFFTCCDVDGYCFGETDIKNSNLLNKTTWTETMLVIGKRVNQYDLLIDYCPGSGCAIHVLYYVWRGKGKGKLLDKIE